MFLFRRTHGPEGILCLRITLESPIEISVPEIGEKLNKKREITFNLSCVDENYWEFLIGNMLNKQVGMVFSHSFLTRNSFIKSRSDVYSFFALMMM